MLIIINNNSVVLQILETLAEQKISLENRKIITTLDKQLQNANIPNGLVDLLNNAGFTIDIILNSHPSDIAQKLGIDDYVAQIIYQEIKKVFYGK